MDIFSEKTAVLFGVIVLGLLLGKLGMKGKTIGIAGVLFVGLFMGHFGAEVPNIIQSIGMIFFVTAVGLTAGMDFKSVFTRYGKSYLLITVTVLGSGMVLTLLLALLFGYDAELAAGMMVGALTSTPGLGAALEAAGGSAQVGVGYAVTYPMGVVGVVGGIHVVSYWYENYMAPHTPNAKSAYGHTFSNEKGHPAEDTKLASKQPPTQGNLFSLMVVIFLGILLGKIPIPLPILGVFSLGFAGGPLIMAILFGQIGEIGPFNARFPKKSLNLLRDLGAVFVLAEVGTSAGQDFVELFQAHGLVLILSGFLITVILLGLSFMLAVFLAKMDRTNIVGTIAGVMTSTPGLAAAVEAVEDDRPGVAYAAVYPVAILVNSIIAKIVVMAL